MRSRASMHFVTMHRRDYRWYSVEDVPVATGEQRARVKKTCTAGQDYMNQLQILRQKISSQAALEHPRKKGKISGAEVADLMG